MFKEMSKNDFLIVRNMVADDGMEMTPSQLLELIEEATGDTYILTDDPGLSGYLNDYS